MNIKYFTDYAMEGGWIKTLHGASVEAMLLDPLAWRAVERAIILSGDDWGRFTHKWIERIVENEARNHMHGMVDALIEGRNINEYLISCYPQTR